MAKSKGARLSLTMPSSHEADNPVVKVADQLREKPAATGKRVAHNGTANAPTTTEGSNAERELASSRSASPGAAFSAASEQSKSPTSPASPTFTSLPQHIPASPEKKGKEQPRGFFQNMKASRSSSKIQSPEPTIRPVQSEVVSPEETPKGPHRTKSTPEMRGGGSPGPVPDLPHLDNESSQTSCKIFPS